MIALISVSSAEDVRTKVETMPTRRAYYVEPVSSTTVFGNREIAELFV